MSPANNFPLTIIFEIWKNIIERKNINLAIINNVMGVWPIRLEKKFFIVDNHDALGLEFQLCI